MDFSRVETLVLNRVQVGIPCASEPFRVMADELSLKEDEVLETVAHLKEKKIIRNISGIFDGKKLGYYLSLVAFEVPEERADAAGAVISSHPGVSHNYLRNHRYNIWFTLAEECEDDFYKTVSVLAIKAGADDYLVLKNESLLKIGVFLNIGESEDVNHVTAPYGAEYASYLELDETAKDAVRLLQRDLPVEKQPFKKIAEEGKLIYSEEQVLSYYLAFLESGIMRRYAAVLKHRSAGFTANAMTAWKTDEVTDLELFINEKSVSHLYLRTVYPGRWEYPLFAMIHAKSQDELDGIIKELSEKSGITDFLALESLKEFKKKRVTYFSGEFKEWKRLNYD
ncbi:MAG TPA: Lrp/AsnC family transcriptional regulator [Spirochaetota bacterium]|nr:Lrp/AsnC family transcriptional regulator [Spirochaetota bacterium]HPF07221.1 Lrp/AsnC family transcriptional regulator [Spirochaetota bacterium]HPJ43164.1 Lrp/AsnC family transcriptional regulator [Spirochaetota bacterium]HPR38625.1 Lrp/AsnC family transcriptional regulator [Spirochaetota bacterium]HRX48695.1 Lrp/AsnC family transcriptional regulator [Spirochaetota bacterium]